MTTNDTLIQPEIHMSKTPKFTKLTKKDVNKVRALYREGKARGDIAHDLGFSYAQVSYAIKKKPMRNVTTAQQAAKTDRDYDLLESKYLKAVALLIKHDLIPVNL